MPPVLAYWDIRGLAQPIRLLLHYVGEEYEEKLYECGPAPDFNKDCWFGVKNSFGLEFPNLPYYIDGDVKITQSNTILRYIARKHNLCGTTESEKIRVDLMTDQGMDFRNGLVWLCYNSKAEQMLPDYLKNIKTSLEGFEKFLGDRPYFAGDSVTYVDFILYELLDQHRTMFKDSLKGYDKLNAFLDRIEALPNIKKYMTSADFLKGPINNKIAVFK